jgi:hypothetical protein
MTRFRYLCFYLAIPAVGFGHTGTAAFQTRRQTAAEKAAGGIILLHANSGMKHWEEAGFHQDPNFYYFTGLRNAQAAILAIDGTSKESWLFVRPKMARDKDLPGLDAVYPLAGSESEAAFAIERVVPWNDFVTPSKRRC